MLYNHFSIKKRILIVKISKCILVLIIITGCHFSKVKYINQLSGNYDISVWKHPDFVYLYRKNDSLKMWVIDDKKVKAFYTGDILQIDRKDKK